METRELIEQRRLLERKRKQIQRKKEKFRYQEAQNGKDVEKNSNLNSILFF
jgi:hypothetical protein